MFRVLLFHENGNKQSFQLLPRVAEAFLPELTEATFGHVSHTQKAEVCRFAFESALRVCKRHEAEVSPKLCEENIASAKLEAK